MLRLVLALVSSLLLAVIAIPAQQYPNPIVDPVSCWNHTNQRPMNLLLCDPDGLVADDQAVTLNRLLLTLRRETACPCNPTVCHISKLSGRDYGFTTSIALVRTMNDGSVNLIPRARQYADTLRRMREYYGPGFTRCDEDIIIFLSLNEKVVYILTGAEAQQRISDNDLENLIQSSHDHFDEVAQGLQYLVREIQGKLPKKP